MNEYIVELPLKPCPWCKITPEAIMCTTKGEETWQWYVQCINSFCTVQPKAKHINLRKNQKHNLLVLNQKLCDMFNNWNESNDYPAFMKKVIDLTPLIKGDK